MKLQDAITLGGCLTSLTTALVLEKNSYPAVIAFPLEIKPCTESSNKKRAAFSMSLANSRQFNHVVSMSIGTPPQKVQAIFDTASSGLMVYDSEADICKKHNEYCKDSGVFTPKKSSTYRPEEGEMKADFLSGQSAKGDYAEDTLNLGPITVKNMQLSIMKETDVSQNILGVSYTEFKNIVQPKLADERPHNNLPALLVKQKYIESRAFSLWMNDLQSPTGEILFGGVDTEKYTGDLLTVPFVERVKGMVIDFSILLKKVQMTNDKESMVDLPTKNTPMFALLDSGSTQTVLPDDIYDAIIEKLGGKKTPEIYVPTVSCSMIKNTTTIDFLFENDLMIKAPLSQFIAPVDGSEDCPVWGLAKSSNMKFNTIILGSSFLSSAYVVFDMDHKEASIAQAKWNPKKSNILQIKAGGHAVPGMTKTWHGLLPVGKTIGDWKYLGCANETAPRTLNEASFIAKNMTIEACQSYCQLHNFKLSGVQWSQECFCGQVLSNGGAVGALGCNMPCKGNAEEVCGGADHISIFEDTAFAPITNPPISNKFGYFGCYVELQDARLLSGPSTKGNVTAEICTSFCRAQSPRHLWAGLQYANECYCATELPKSAAPAPETSCDMVCSGSKKEFCGGFSRISMYKLIDSP